MVPPMTSPPSRRDVLRTVSAAAAAVPILGSAWLLTRLAGAPVVLEGPDRVPLARPEEVPPAGEVLERSVRLLVRRGPQREVVSELVFLTRDPESGQIIALSGRCTHLGCSVRRTPRGTGVEAPLECPCHSATFSATGEVLDGPPPRPLDRLAIEIPEQTGALIQLVLTR